MRRHNLKTLATALIAVVLLSACHARDIPVAGKAMDSLNGHDQEVEKRLATAAQNAIKAGEIDSAFDKYQKLYNTAVTQDSSIALNYAQLLRKKGFPKKSVKVLQPLVENRRSSIRHDAEPILMNELAASLIEIGHFKHAEKLLSHIQKSEEAKEFHADSHNLMGIISGARKDYPQAESHFRSALEGWKGDATSVKNNLAVCLASQGKFDEALMLLRQALIEAPEKGEIAQNIELISDLRDAVVPMPY